jgi:PAS domain S-box-containing protein
METSIRRDDSPNSKFNCPPYRKEARFDHHSKPSETAHSVSPKNGAPRWMPAGSIVISLAALTLLVATLLARFYTGFLSSILLTLVLVALCAAIGLHVRYLLLVRREQRETTTALDLTESEFKSVVNNALDGILILDDRGICLEANPAAQTLFGARYNELVGEPIGKFHAGGDFGDTWKSFLKRKYEHGETKLCRKDGSTIFVEYTAKADYLPGRHVAVLRDITRRKRSEAALRESETRFQQMATEIAEIFWMLDAETKRVIYVNRAYQTITGRPCETLRDNPTSYEDLIYPEDRVRVLSRLDETEKNGQFDEEFRIERADGAIRWVWVRGFPVRDANGVVRSLVGTAQDISARKSAETQMARNLDLAESARAEADAFRKTTLALTENLSMDYVLDTLLESLLKLIPCESARILLLEADSRLFLAREVQHYETTRRVAKCPTTLDATKNRWLHQVVTTSRNVLVSDTSQENGWQDFKGYSHLRSWLCVPLVTREEVLGLLSLGDTRAGTFTPEHLRLAKSLAIPAAVAIQNARLYERAAIYSTELEQRLTDLEQAQHALREARENGASSEERFRKIFRSSPIAFSITTADDGRIVDVNEAFERRYGYPREGIVGRTVFEIGIWADPTDRVRMLDELREKGSVRNRLARLRKSSGEAMDTAYSVETIDLDGMRCLLAVSTDLSERDREPSESADRKTALAP